MTTPMQPFDVNNPLLSTCPARLDGGTLTTPDGRRGVLSMRTTSATVTSIMIAEDLRNWAKFINALADEVDGGKSLQAASPLDLAALSQAMQASKG